MKYRKAIAALLGAALMFGTAGCEIPLRNAAMPRTSSNAENGSEVCTSVAVTSPAQTRDGDAEKIFSSSDEHSAKQPGKQTASSDANTAEQPVGSAVSPKQARCVNTEKQSKEPTTPTPTEAPTDNIPASSESCNSSLQESPSMPPNEKTTALAESKPEETLAPTVPPQIPCPTQQPSPSPVVSSPTASPTPETTAKPTEKPKVWVVDVAGHWKTVTETVQEEVWVEEQGHYETVRTEIYQPKYSCNHCGKVSRSEEEAETHSWEEFDRGNAGSYTYVGLEVIGYETAQEWVIDSPAHTETVERTEERTVWVDEIGHWE